MDLRLGPFGRAGLEALAEQDGVVPQATIEAAGALYAETASHLRDGQKERPGWLVLRRLDGTRDEPLTRVSIRLKDEQWLVLEGEAHPRVFAEHVLEHSAMRYLASRTG